MSVIQSAPPQTVAPYRTAADLLADLGVQPERVFLDPPPGTATEADLLAWHGRWDRDVLCELVAGTLVAKELPSPECPVRTRRLADFLADWGVPADRVLLDPPPGTATEADVVAACERKDLCELLDGILVEKAMGAPESYVAGKLLGRLDVFLEATDLGYAYAPDALIRFAPDRVRLPDVSFVSWVRRPERTVPRTPVSDIVPNLVVEILSPSNTRAEMARKLGVYFAAGVELAWLIDPARGTAEAYTSPTDVTAVPPGDALDGGTVLPGLVIPLARLFAGFGPPAAP